MSRYASHLAGRNYGRLGTVVDHPPVLTIHGYDTTHALNRAVQRDGTTADRFHAVRDPLVVLEQRQGQAYLFLSERAVVVLKTDGMVITTYGVSDFDDKIRQILNDAGAH